MSLILDDLKSPLLEEEHKRGDDSSIESIASAEDVQGGTEDARLARKLEKFDKSFFEESQRKITFSGMDIVARSQVSRIERSWLIISDSNRIGEVGEKFFFKMFDEYPELVNLFPFGEDAIDRKTGKFKVNARTKRHVQAHASAVMRVVGSCVAGLTQIEELVPRLRNVGATHKVVGVQNMHYDILFRHMIHAIREEVGPDNWDQETEEAWENAFISITDLIKRPSKRLETEPLRGWGIFVLAACVYFTIITPVRFAGFFIGRSYVILFLDILDTLAVLVMALDLFIYIVQQRFRVQKKRHTIAAERELADSSDTMSQTSGISKMSRTSQISWIAKRRNKIVPYVQAYISKKHRGLIKRLNRWNMDKWVPWPSLDVKVLVSFILQGFFVRTSLCAQFGLHWTQLFGLIRLSCASRVLHFVQCAENNALLGQQLDAERQLQLRIVKLLVRLAFLTHVSACLWCAVARVELGVDATEFTASPFFPDPEILSYSSGRHVFTSYSRALHWAFVNLSGIGGVESVPSTALECWLVLLVHMGGAIFYAIVTGSVISVLEETSKNENKIGRDIVKLSNYLQTARVGAASKERIMKGYMMRNVLTDGNEIKPELDGLLDPNDGVLGTLPNYLRAEVAIYARAETIRRRDKFFAHCSNGFLVGLSSTLSKSRTLLTGDYYLQKGKVHEREFAVIESGSLQVRYCGHTLRELKRGDCIGKAWLIQKPNNAEDFHDIGNEDTDWLLPDGTAALSIRALSPCVLMTGLTSVEDIRKLENGYAVDFRLLRAEAKGNAMKENELSRRAKAMNGIGKAVRRFKERKSLIKRPEAEREGETVSGGAGISDSAILRVETESE